MNVPQDQLLTYGALALVVLAALWYALSGKPAPRAAAPAQQPPPRPVGIVDIFEAAGREYANAAVERRMGEYKARVAIKGFQEAFSDPEPAEKPAPN